jgi:arabinose-5-phosphate isomerase
LAAVGITGVDGRLTGIITDGDLRRHMRADLLAARVDDVMTKNPKTVAAISWSARRWSF